MTMMRTLVLAVVLASCGASWPHSDFKRRIELTFSPTRLESHVAGLLAHAFVPRPLRYIFWQLFVTYEGIDMSETRDTDYGNYPTFASFFGRSLKEEARPVDQPEDCSILASPCDGHVLTLGDIDSENFTIDCVKGRSYRLDEFMLGVKGNGEVSPPGNREPPINSGVKAMVDKVKARGNRLMYTVIYLSPADYHHFHSPVCHTADYRRHIAGDLTLVRGSYAIHHPDTYKTNERVSIFGQWEQGFYFEAPVGATNVGSIILNYDDSLQTDAFSPPYPFYYDRSYARHAGGPFARYLNTSTLGHDSTVPNFRKGEETGRFDMGSTIVLIFEAIPATTWAVKEGDRLKLGHRLTSRS